jgi:hypothetical protein
MKNLNIYAERQSLWSGFLNLWLLTIIVVGTKVKLLLLLTWCLLHLSKQVHRSYIFSVNNHTYVHRNLINQLSIFYKRRRFFGSDSKKKLHSGVLVQCHCVIIKKCMRHPKQYGDIVRIRCWNEDNGQFSWLRDFYISRLPNWWKNRKWSTTVWRNIDVNDGERTQLDHQVEGPRGQKIWTVACELQ